MTRFLLLAATLVASALADHGWYCGVGKKMCVPCTKGSSCPTQSEVYDTYADCRNACPATVSFKDFGSDLISQGIAKIAKFVPGLEDKADHEKHHAFYCSDGGHCGICLIDHTCPDVTFANRTECKDACVAATTAVPATRAPHTAYYCSDRGHCLVCALNHNCPDETFPGREECKQSCSGSTDTPPLE